MGLPSAKEKLLYQGVVPIVAALVGALAATWFQAANLDQSQLTEILKLINDPQLTADQKIQAFQIYQEITDRPWSIIRTLMTIALVALGAAIAGGLFMRRHD